MVKILGIIILLTGAGCSMESNTRRAEIQKAKVNTPAQSGEILTIDTAESIIRWTGTKKLGSRVTGSHSGNIHLSSGHLVMAGHHLIGGKFQMKMQDIILLDKLDENDKTKLVNHLKSDQFFDVEKYPYSYLEIVETAMSDDDDYNYLIVGNLTLKDTTLSITFPAEFFEHNDKYIAEAKFAIDRTRWKVYYRQESNVADRAKDWFINDNIDLDILIVANK